MTICPCVIADKPCHVNCTCIQGWSSRGCACCCTYGSFEQRKQKANRLVELSNTNLDKLEEVLNKWKNDLETNI
jgi:hypothetical protein